MKSIVKTTGVVYLCFLFLSCDFQEIEKFEIPTWNWPLSFPLLEERYTFAEMGVNFDSTLGYYVNANGDSAVNNNIYFNPEDSSLFIEFSANLMGEDSVAVGVDESFSQYFSIESMNLGDIESIDIDPIEFPPVDVSIPTAVPITVFPSDTIDVFEDPLNFFSDLFIPENSLVIDSSFQQEVFTVDDLILFESVDSITIDGGLIGVTITNTFPFDISNLNLLFITDNRQIWSANFDNVGNGETSEQSLIISDENMTGFTQNLYVEYSIRIDPQQGDTTCLEFNEGEDLSPGELATCSGLNTGWGLSSALTDHQLLMNIDFEINSAYSITGRTLPQGMSEELKIGLPPNDLIQVVGGKITDDYSFGDTNSLALNLENNLFAPITFSMEFPNFYDTSGNILEIDTLLELGSLYQDDLSFAGKHMGHATNPGNEIDSIKVITQITIESYDATLLLDDPGGFDINEIMVSQINLEYVTAATDSLEFETPSIEIADIPSGFAGFEFFDLTLEFNIYNQIGIPVILDLELKGFKETGDTVTLNIDPELSYNNVDKDGNLFIDSDASLQDSAWTRVVLDKSGQTTYQYVMNSDNTEWTQIDSVFVEKESTILDVMAIAPDGMLVSGGANINGQGILAPNTFVWGDFTLIAPLSFLFAEDITFVPAESTILDTMDLTTRAKIDSALIVAQMTMDITNSIPFGGDLSLLISDYNSGLCVDSLSETCQESYFPVYFNQFEQNDLSAQSIDTSYSSIFTIDSTFLTSELGVSAILVEGLSDDNTDNFIVNFLDEDGDTLFWIGKLFSLNIEPPDTVESQTGFVQVPSNYLDILELDTTRISWITTDKSMQMMPIITFENTNDFYCEDGSDADLCMDSGESGICLDGGECLREPRAFQTSNYIEISSFITFTLNTGALFESIPSKQIEKKTSNSGKLK